MATTTEDIIKGWLGLPVEERETVLRADPDALDLAWMASNDEKRRAFAFNWNVELQKMIRSKLLKPGWEVKSREDKQHALRHIAAMRRDRPGDPDVASSCAELEQLLVYLP